MSSDYSTRFVISLLVKTENSLFSIRFFLVIFNKFFLKNTEGQPGLCLKNQQKLRNYAMKWAIINGSNKAPFFLYCIAFISALYMLPALRDHFMEKSLY